MPEVIAILLSFAPQPFVGISIELERRVTQLENCSLRH